MTTALTVGFRADPYCWALSSFHWSCWSPSRPPRNWVSSARCSEGFDFVIAVMAAIIIIGRGDISRVIVDAYASRAVIATAAAAAVVLREAADSSAKAVFSGGRVAA
jgi:hypothetical protein